MPTITAAVTRIEPLTSTPPTQADALVLHDQGAAQQERRNADRHVDQEDPVPADRLGERAADQEADRAAADGHEDVDAHGSRPLEWLGEVRDDDRDDDRGGERGAHALQEAGRHEQRLVRGQRAQRRGGGEEDDAGEEDALAADEVAEAAGHEQEAAERDQVRVDHPGQVRLGEVQVALDGRQRDVHDGRVERVHELSEADHDEGDPASKVSGGLGRCGRW
jgi:hypothetical protein